MNRHIFHRRFRWSIIKAGILAITVCTFLFPSYTKYTSGGDNYFTITLNNQVVGVLSTAEKAQKCLIDARRLVASKSTDMVFVDVDMEVVGEERVYARVDSEDTVVENMTNVLLGDVKETLRRAYTVKINDTAVNLASYEEVDELLEQALDQYDTYDEYDVSLVLDPTREVNVLTTSVTAKDLLEDSDTDVVTNAGITTVLESMVTEAMPEQELDFEDYEQGLIEIDFADSVEVVEAYLLEDELISVEEAVDLLTKEQETQIIYKVQSGDTLSEISLMYDIPMDDLVAINSSLDDVNSTLQIDQELIITVPEPDLSISWKEQAVYVEEYDEEIQYIYNDEWYTNQQQTLQQPSAGVRKVVAVTEYNNDSEETVEVLKEEIYSEAVPKIVEKGTKIPPTYIKPISGGRLSSGFGSRTSPTAGASTNHKGVDWSVPTGTPVVASNGGTVVTAGWVNGYGYAVYINHDDGRQTRYGHLSKVLVKVGQRVNQGDRIALSGNTGRSTGPHLHFEIRINGTAVNPLNYLE